MSENYFSNFVLSFCGSLIATVIINIVNLLTRRKSTDDKEKIKNIRSSSINKLAPTLYSFQIFLLIYLVVSVILVIIAYIFVDFSKAVLGYFDIDRVIFIYTICEFLAIAFFILLIQKTADLKRFRQRINFHMEVTTKLNHTDLARGLKSNKTDLNQLISLIFSDILKLSMGAQSKFYLGIIKFIFWFRSLPGTKREIILAIWLKLPNKKKKEFEAVKVKCLPVTVSDDTKLINTIKLPFHKDKQIERWEKAKEKLEKNIESMNRVNQSGLEEAKLKLKKHLGKFNALSSDTGRIYYENKYLLIPHYEWKEEKERVYKELLKDNWSNFKFRSIAGIPLIYNKKKLGVLMLTSNIPFMLRIYDIDILRLYCFSLSKIIYFAAPKNFFGIDFVNLVKDADNAELLD